MPNLGRQGSGSDRLTRFSHTLTQIKFIILEIVIFVGFLLWLWDKVMRDFHLNVGTIHAW